jgi:Protein of unknown function (DUF3300)
MILLKQMLAVILSGGLMITGGCAAAAAPGIQATELFPVQPAQMPAEQLQQLVAPIALYPDALVAQILAASTYPTEVVEAQRWLQQHSGLQGTQLASEVDKQSWDPSVKALTQFPSVLANMNNNLSWMSALGDAYFNDQQDVLNAVQVMRKRAQDAGTLKATPQEKVIAQAQTIILEPANPQVVYVPQYNPWIVYGAPLAVYPGYISGPWIAAPIISFGIGFPIGWGFGWGWGWPAWGCNWHDRFVVFNHNRFVSRSPSFIHRGQGFRGGHDFRGNFDHRADRGFAAPHGAPGDHSGAFHGFDQGAVANQHSFRGQSSVGGSMHGGFGGGIHGGFGGGHR